MATKYPHLLLALLLSLFVRQAYPQSAITIGKTATLHSNILQEDRHILIYLPPSTSDTYFYPRRYPVVYLLDGDSHFLTVSGIIAQLSGDHGLAFPEMIVVAIQNTDRNRDLTPTRVTKVPQMDSAGASRTGGGEKFLGFISRELMPYIDSLYPTAPYRMFIGHSLGGLTVINTLIHHPSLFNSYIAIDPSMSWDNGKILQQAALALQQDSFPHRSLFLAIANSDLSLSKFAAAGMDTNLLIAHHRSILTLRDDLMKAASRPGGIHAGWKFYPDYEHSDLPPVAEYDGLRFLFHDYPLEISPFFNAASGKADTAISTHYKAISRQMGYTVLPPESVINDLGYSCLGRGQLSRARYFFQLNVDNYPKSFNVYDSMGDYYVAAGDYKMAIKLYEKALTLRDNPDTQKKLDKLTTGR